MLHKVHQIAKAASQNQKILEYYGKYCSNEMLQILNISLTNKTHLIGLFDKTKFQKDKE